MNNREPIYLTPADVAALEAMDPSARKRGAAARWSDMSPAEINLRTALEQSMRIAQMERVIAGQTEQLERQGWALQATWGIAAISFAVGFCAATGIFVWAMCAWGMR